MEGLDLQKILRIAFRRLWWWFPILCLGLTVSAGVAYFLPSIYRASAFILVEGQQIPKEYVQSTVTTDIQNRLHSLSQEILSRDRLEKLIVEYNLYAKARQEEPLQQVIATMRHDIGIEIKNVDRRGRQDESSVAFEVSYGGTDPETVTLVANRLASFYIQGNLELRERQAVGTTDFISSQVQNVKKQLEDQEQKIAAFKREHLGELPEQLDANLKTVERLQAQLQLNSDNLIKARERRDLLAKELDLYRRAASEEGAGKGELLAVPGLQVDDLDKEIDKATRALAVLRGRFSDSHPDVIRAQQELDALKAEQNGREPGAEDGQQSTKSEPRDAYTLQVRKQLGETDAEIRFLTQDIIQTREAIAGYQKRIEDTPRREQELSKLTRDYESTRELYASLLKRKEEAELATSMEQRQKAERFRIIDPAIRPALPEGPNRPRILLMGLVLSLGLGGGIVVLLEMLNKSFGSAEDLEKITDIPILVSIPRIQTRADRFWMHFKTALASILLIFSVAGAAAASYYVAKGNDTLVKRFTSGGGGQQLR